jgi:hypothetical protein
MFRSISGRIDLPSWMGSVDQDTRWRRLTVFDLILDGKFYDHLKHDFYTEKLAGGGEVAIQDRRPSVQYRLPRYAARWAARKMFAGRHIPQVASEDAKVQTAIASLLSQIRVWPTMFEAAYRGSVGSVAITFRAINGKIGLNVWRAAVCTPEFDDLGDLRALTVHYVVPGRDLLRLGFRDIESQAGYWFIRHYDENQEITFRPIEKSKWNPVDGDPGLLIPADGEMPTINHGLGFVPAVWIANLGGTPPDGACLWEDAIPNSIEIDYLMSQGARGTRYNSAPELVTQGRIINLPDDGDMVRSPTRYLAFDAATRLEDGSTIGGGDAKLLEMSGAGAEATIKLVEELKKMALEQIGLVQKDPSKLPGPLSGRAMEFLDEDSHDVAMQWRSTYGDGGALPLIRKIVKVLSPKVDTDGLWLRWPRLYQPTPQDLVDMTNALRMAVAPQAVTTGEGETGKTVTIIEPLVDLPTASAFLRANMDLTVLGNEDSVQHAGMAAQAPVEGDAGGDQGQEIGFGPHYRVFPRINLRI